MGCGACADVEVRKSKYLCSRMKSRLAYLQDSHRESQQSDTFISKAEIKRLMDLQDIYPLPALSQVRLPNETHSDALITPERRMTWKVAVMSTSLNLFSHYTYCEKPIATNKQSQLRFNEIGLDINRTFPQNKSLNRKDLQVALQNITLHFQGVGYAQGMNLFIGFFLLCGFTARQSYQLFVYLSHDSRYLLIRNFTQSFKNVSFCLALLNNKLQQHGNPQLLQAKEKVEMLGLSNYFYSFTWFLSYMLYNLDLQVSLLLWDLILLHNPQQQNPEESSSDKYLLGGGLLNLIPFVVSLFGTLAEEILACESAEEIASLMRNSEIQKRITVTEALAIIDEAKKNTIDWKDYLNYAGEFDKELRQIIEVDKAGSQSEAAQQFYNSCYYLPPETLVADSNSKTKIRQIKVTSSG